MLFINVKAAFYKLTMNNKRIRSLVGSYKMKTFLTNVIICPPYGAIHLFLSLRLGDFARDNNFCFTVAQLLIAHREWIRSLVGSYKMKTFLTNVIICPPYGAIHLFLSLRLGDFARDNNFWLFTHPLPSPLPIFWNSRNSR